ncbi:protein SCO1/2 [Salibacterium salarium]|uniref:SCO family protein n=1 Tax=Salibacterium salarium TaxID=284579 RepID=UPI002788AC4F|nr:SCO family protein [Salibacterium salarium]MDQ0300512.1 protein SCO1/2 [Salibacterium salarium]
MRQSFHLFWMISILICVLSGCSWLHQTGFSSAESGTDLTDADLQMQSFEFTNQDGETMSNEDFQDTYWIADMIFTSCPTVCNTMTPNMLNLQGQAEKAGLDLQFVSFTVAPSFDDPEQLKKYAEKYGADFSNWHFLTGYTDEDIRQLSQNTFQSVVEKIPEENNVIHATAFFLIDPEGNVIRKYDGLENDTERIVEDVKRLN